MVRGAKNKAKYHTLYAVRLKNCNNKHAKNDIRISVHVVSFMPLKIIKETWIKDKIQSEIYTLTFVCK